MKILIPAFVLVLTGCVSAPDVSPIPELVQNPTAAQPRRASNAGWWTLLADDKLNQLMQVGLSGSPTNRAASARVAQAEAGLKVARAARWPTLTAAASGDAQNVSGAEDSRADLGSLGLTWDAGLWGKRRLQIDAAREFLNERWFEHQSVQLTLSALIAETYFQIVEQKLQSALLADQLKVSIDLERLIEERFRRGQARANEVYQQREATQGLQQLKIIVDTQLTALEISLDALLGQAPDAVSRVNVAIVPIMPVLAETGAPEQLIRHRPDLRASFARLRQTAAAAGISIVERLPTLEVTANLTSLAQKSMSTEWFGHGLNLAAPIFSGGRLRGLQAQAFQRLEEERQNYHAVWLTAMEEVATLTWQYSQQQAVIAAVEERREFAQLALDAAQNRYVRGDQNYLDVLTALRGLQEADRLLISERMLLVALWVQVMEAAGQRMCGNSADCEQHWHI